MAFIGNQPAESFTSFATQEFSTSATTSYTLDHAVTNENEIALFVNNVRQQPGSGKAYTASGTTLTLSAATASTDTMYCVFLGRALQTVTPATNSITAAMVGNDLISGKDALTSSPADTDELLISDAGVLKRIDVSLVGGKNTPAFSAYKSSQTTGQSDSTWTKITYDTELLDSDGTFASSRFTPAVAGKYFISLNATAGTSNASSVDQASVAIYKNGSAVDDNTAKVESEVELITNTISAIVDLDTDDYIEGYIYINQSTGTNRITSSQLSGFKIIGA